MAWPTQQYTGQMPKFVAPPPTQIYYAPPVKRFKPLHPLHLLCWDKYLHKKIIPTSQPPIINKGKLGITDLGTKATINHREAVNDQTLPTMLWQIDQPKILHDQMD